LIIAGQGILDQVSLCC